MIVERVGWTPGPWRVVPRLGVGYTIIAQLEGRECFTAHVSEESDAALIAAAPDLAAFAEFIEAGAQGIPTNHLRTKLGSMARELLSKATGAP